MLNWEGYMGTYNSLAPHIQFSKPIPVTHVDRDKVIADFFKNKPNWAELGRAIGYLAFHSTSLVLRNALESAHYPNRLDYVAAYTEAHNANS